MEETVKESDLMYQLLETVDSTSRVMLDIQLELATMQREIEEHYSDAENIQPVSARIEYIPEPPQELKIVTGLHPPKLIVPPALFLRKTKRGNKRSAYSEVRDLWYSTIKKALKDQGLIDEFEPFEKATIWYTLFFDDKRVHDVDRYSIKAINDVLSRLRIIEDDSYAHIQCVISGAFDSTLRTEIIVVEGTGHLERFSPKLS